MKHTLLAAALLLTPIIVFGQAGETKTFGDLVNRALTLVNPVILLIMGLALIFFLWGLAKFIYKSGDEKSEDEGKQIMIWGITALFVMLSVWGIVELFQYTFFGRIPDPAIDIRP